jgi:hypothetical protein
MLTNNQERITFSVAFSYQLVIFKSFPLIMAISILNSINKNSKKNSLFFHFFKETMYFVQTILINWFKCSWSFQW